MDSRLTLGVYGVSCARHRDDSAAAALDEESHMRPLKGRADITTDEHDIRAVLGFDAVADWVRRKKGATAGAELPALPGSYRSRRKTEGAPDEDGGDGETTAAGAAPSPSPLAECGAILATAEAAHSATARTRPTRQLQREVLAWVRGRAPAAAGGGGEPRALSLYPLGIAPSLCDTLRAAAPADARERLQGLYHACGGGGVDDGSDGPPADTPATAYAVHAAVRQTDTAAQVLVAMVFAAVYVRVAAGDRAGDALAKAAAADASKLRRRFPFLDPAHAQHAEYQRIRGRVGGVDIDVSAPEHATHDADRALLQRVAAFVREASAATPGTAVGGVTATVDGGSAAPSSPTGPVGLALGDDSSSDDAGAPADVPKQPSDMTPAQHTVVDKVVSMVVQKGPAVEAKLRAKEGRFEFLQDTHPWYTYYCALRDAAMRAASRDGQQDAAAAVAVAVGEGAASEAARGAETGGAVSPSTAAAAAAGVDLGYADRDVDDDVCAGAAGFMLPSIPDEPPRPREVTDAEVVAVTKVAGLVAAKGEGYQARLKGHAGRFEFLEATHALHGFYQLWKERKLAERRRRNILVAAMLAASGLCITAANEAANTWKVAAAAIAAAVASLGVVAAGVTPVVPPPRGLSKSLTEHIANVAAVLAANRLAYEAMLAAQEREQGRGAGYLDLTDPCFASFDAYVRYRTAQDEVAAGDGAAAGVRGASCEEEREWGDGGAGLARLPVPHREGVVDAARLAAAGGIAVETEQIATQMSLQWLHPAHPYYRAYDRLVAWARRRALALAAEGKRARAWARRVNKKLSDRCPTAAVVGAAGGKGDVGVFDDVLTGVGWRWERGGARRLGQAVIKTPHRHTNTATAPPRAHPSARTFEPPTVLRGMNAARRTELLRTASAAALRAVEAELTVRRGCRPGDLAYEVVDPAHPLYAYYTAWVDKKHVEAQVAHMVGDAALDPVPPPTAAAGVDGRDSDGAPAQTETDVLVVVKTATLAALAGCAAERAAAGQQRAADGDSSSVEAFAFTHPAHPLFGFYTAWLARARAAALRRRVVATLQRAPKPEGCSAEDLAAIDAAAAPGTPAATNNSGTGFRPVTVDTSSPSPPSSFADPAHPHHDYYRHACLRAAFKNMGINVDTVAVPPRPKPLGADALERFVSRDGRGALDESEGGDTAEYVVAIVKAAARRVAAAEVAAIPADDDCLLPIVTSAGYYAQWVARKSTILKLRGLVPPDPVAPTGISVRDPAVRESIAGLAAAVARTLVGFEREQMTGAAAAAMGKVTAAPTYLHVTHPLNAAYRWCLAAKRRAYFHSRMLPARFPRPPRPGSINTVDWARLTALALHVAAAEVDCMHADDSDGDAYGSSNTTATLILFTSPAHDYCEGFTACVARERAGAWAAAVETPDSPDVPAPAPRPEARRPDEEGGGDVVMAGTDAVEVPSTVLPFTADDVIRAATLVAADAREFAVKVAAAAGEYRSGGFPVFLPQAHPVRGYFEAVYQQTLLAMRREKLRLDELTATSRCFVEPTGPAAAAAVATSPSPNNADVDMTSDSDDASDPAGTVTADIAAWLARATAPIGGEGRGDDANAVSTGPDDDGDAWSVVSLEAGAEAGGGSDVDTEDAEEEEVVERGQEAEETKGTPDARGGEEDAKPTVSAESEAVRHEAAPNGNEVVHTTDVDANGGEGGEAPVAAVVGRAMQAAAEGGGDGGDVPDGPAKRNSEAVSTEADVSDRHRTSRSPSVAARDAQVAEAKGMEGRVADATMTCEGGRPQAAAAAAARGSTPRDVRTATAGDPGPPSHPADAHAPTAPPQEQTQAAVGADASASLSPEQQARIERAAGYIAGHGRSYEARLLGREGGGTKFAFVHEGREGHAYYLQRLEAEGMQVQGGKTAAAAPPRGRSPHRGRSVSVSASSSRSSSVSSLRRRGGRRPRHARDSGDARSRSRHRRRRSPSWSSRSTTPERERGWRGRRQRSPRRSSHASRRSGDRDRDRDRDRRRPHRRRSCSPTPPQRSSHKRRRSPSPESPHRRRGKRVQR